MPFISPVTVTAGFALASHHRLDDGVAQESTEPDLDVNVGYRLMLSEPRRLAIALGMHAGLSHDSAFDEQLGNTTKATLDSSMYSFDVGVVAGFELDRFWIAPWVGRHIGTRTNHSTHYSGCVTMCTSVTEQDFTIAVPTLGSGGALVGFDVWSHGPHRVSVFASVQVSSTIRDEFMNHAQYRYSAFGVGIAYRL